MSNYSSLKATINANVKTNGNQEISGAVLNSVLNAMVDSEGAGYQFMGVATPSSPGTAQTPDYKCFYLASTPGTYTYLGGLVVADGEVAILKYDTAWSKEVTGAASAADLSQLGQKVGENTLARLMDGRAEFEQGAITSNGDNSGSSPTIWGRFVNAIKTPSYLCLPDGYRIREIYYYSAWTSPSSFTLSTYVTANSQGYSFDTSYPYVRIAVRKSDGSAFDIEDLIKAISSTEEKISNLNVNVFGPLRLRSGYLSASNGNAVFANGWSYTEYIPIDDILSDKIEMSRAASSSSSAAAAVVYDSSKAVVQILASLTNPADKSVITAADAKYIRFSFTNVTADIYLYNYDLRSAAKSLYDKTTTLESKVDNMAEGVDVPEYFKTELASVATSVYEKATHPCLIFNVITDTHLDKNNADNARRNKESVGNIVALNRLVRSDGVVHLGDILAVSMNTETTDTLYESIGKYITSLYKAGVKVFPVIGNHDGPSVNAFNPNRWDAVAGRLTDDYTIHSVPQVNSDNVSYWPAYYYRDFPNMNVRCIFLSTPESNEKYTFALSQKQLKWFAEVALNVDAGTQIIIFAHEAPFDTDISSKTAQYQTLVGICNAFANKTTYSKTDAGYNINVDYSSKTGAKICGYFCGHQHFDHVANPDWTYEGLSNEGNAHSYANEFSFPIVNIGAGLMTSSGSNTFGGTAPSRTDKTATQDLWDTIVYRPDVSKFYLIRFGAGNDREIAIP